MRKRLLWLVCFSQLIACVYAQRCVPAAQSPGTVTAPIRDIIFQNDSYLGRERESAIVDAERNQTYSSNLSDWSSIADETAERVRAAYQDAGFFNAEVTARVVKADPDSPQFNVVVQVGAVGPQYRLGEIDVRNGMFFSKQRLRDLFPIQRGEIFSRNKIAAGLEEMRRLYAANGYVNFVSVPNTEFDDEFAVANLRIDIDQGKQFRVRDIDVIGLNAADKARLLNHLDAKPGDIYDPSAFHGHITGNWVLDPLLIKTDLDEREGLVNILIDVRPKVICPPQGTPCEVNGHFQSCSDWF